MSGRLPTLPLDPEECRAIVASARWSAKVSVQADGCHLWIAGLTNRGYAEIRPCGSRAKVKAHRVAYVAAAGADIPDLVIVHLCRVRRCVNPQHLNPVTARDNTFAPGSEALAAQQLLRSRCPRGHPLEGDNLIPSKLLKGCRECHECNLERSRERVATMRSAAQTLGIGWAEYVAKYGSSKRTALAILGEVAHS